MLRHWSKECISETAFRNLNGGFYLFEAYFAVVSLAWSWIHRSIWRPRCFCLPYILSNASSRVMESLRSSDHELTLLDTDDPRNYCLVSLTLWRYPNLSLWTPDLHHHRGWASNYLRHCTSVRMDIHAETPAGAQQPDVRLSILCGIWCLQRIWLWRQLARLENHYRQGLPRLLESGRSLLLHKWLLVACQRIPRVSDLQQ